MNAKDDLSPPGQPGKPFPDQRDTFRFFFLPVDPADTSSRRARLRAYFTFMRPGYEQRLQIAWEKSLNKTLVHLWEEKVKVVPTRWLEYKVDKVMWEVWFKNFPAGIAFKWPWDFEPTRSLIAGEDTDGAYAMYRLRRFNEEPEIDPLITSSFRETADRLEWTFCGKPKDEGMEVLARVEDVWLARCPHDKEEIEEWLNYWRYTLTGDRKYCHPFIASSKR
ncbi:hypothetical protein F53441_12315 [Fusarium austroafricanum]|uniref:Uncharacterized protein n=1 Tax=Fusarium austroafricanum TaxID=2364996 RepID=A0A8H4JYV8_9HYPO|nr:hypothetical protein F53441_12315 [Fusarium austroafricanum]